MKILQFFMASLFLFTFLCYSQNPTKIDNECITVTEDEIWTLEEFYISCYVNANHQGILSLMHDKFLGWPDSETNPVDKIVVNRFLEQKYPKPISVQFDIKQPAIQVYGDIAINHYLLYFTGKDDSGEEQKKITRMTHTWIKEDSQWKILGGMSNVQ